jgi:hypothetical protein
MLGWHLHNIIVQHISITFLMTCFVGNASDVALVAGGEHQRISKQQHDSQS